MNKQTQNHNESLLCCEHDDSLAETGGCSHAGHHHGPPPEDTSGSRLLATLAMNLIIPTAQIIGGLMANSVALISDHIKHELLHRFRIDHPVLQFETADCGQGTLLCEMACNGAIGGSISKTQDGEGSIPAHNRLRVQSIVTHALRLLLGTVFLYASYDKIMHPAAFAQAVYNYQILPDAAVNLVALTLPWLELLLGLCLVAGIWLPGATVLSTGLLTVFIGALVFNQIRGLDIHCGCFSSETTDGPAGLWTVARDVSFLVVSAFLMI